jgi:monoamine oxidase
MSTPPDTCTTTVAVVGAGMAGLIAARELHRAGIDVLVLEAADRVGGRVFTETSALGSRLDLGGQWVGHGHHRFETLAAELGATVYPMTTPKQPDMIADASRLSPMGRTMISANLALLRWELGSRRKRTRGGWATQSVHDWIEKHVGSAQARRVLEVMFTVTTCTDSDQMTMETFAALIRHQGGLLTMLKTKGGAQDSLVVEGAGSLAEGLAEGLGDRILTGRRVTGIVQDAAGVTVQTLVGEIRAQRVIVTVPAPMLTSMTFEADLPPARRTLPESTVMGTVYKAIAVYDEPFWRAARATAEAILIDEPGPAVFDTSPPMGPGHLCFLVGGRAAKQLSEREPDERQAALLEQLADRLGPRVTEPASWHEKSWHLDEFVGGGYAAVPKLGTTEGRFPVTHEPSGLLHWAGTETAAEHAGYIEGAIESGQRAAAEVLEILA